MRKLLISTAVMAAVALAACGSSDSATSGFPKPAGTIAVGFTVDDTANKVFTAGQLQWKGSMKYDAATRIITKDAAWTGPWAPLYDDGPYTAGGHEPAGAVAGDNKWGVAVFVAPPATGTEAYEYGLIDVVYETTFGNGWIWVGSNGTFNVAAAATTDQTATGLTLPAFGTKDMQLGIDIAAAMAASNGPWDNAKITVKGSAWAWSEVTLCATAATCTGTKTFNLSDNVGAGKTFVHSGLLHTGDKPEFIFVFNGKEYKDASGNAQVTGLTAGTRTGTTGAFTAATITLAANKNTTITVP
jgi:hypothetical protein